MIVRCRCNKVRLVITAREFRMSQIPVKSFSRRPHTIFSAMIYRPLVCDGEVKLIGRTGRSLRQGKGGSRHQAGVQVRSSGKPGDKDVAGRRGTILGLLAITGAWTGASTGRAGAEDVLAADIESRPEARPLKIRTERAVAIRGDKDIVVANGVLWNKQTVVSSYITFKDMLRKNTRLTAEIGGQRSLGTLSLLGFDPTSDIVVFRSETAVREESLSSALKVVTGNYVVGQSVLSLVRDGDGSFVTTGILSGTDRVVIMANGQKNKGLLQTDCPISLSSAGAGLWTEDGKLLGIFTPGNIPFASFRSDSGVNFVQPGITLLARVPELMRDATNF